MLVNFFPEKCRETFIWLEILNSPCADLAWMRNLACVIFVTTLAENNLSVIRELRDRYPKLYRA